MPEPEELADFVVERMKDNPAVKKIVDDAHLFDGLREHPGWRRLAEKIRSHEKRWMDSITQRLLRGETVDQQEIKYRLGFYEGARYVIETPENAEAALEQAADRAWKEVLRQSLIQQERESPYLITDIPQEGN